MVYHFGVNFVASLFVVVGFYVQNANVTLDHQEHTALKTRAAMVRPVACFTETTHPRHRHIFINSLTFIEHNCHP